MAAPHQPFWLTAPTRFAALKRAQARTVLLLAGLLILLCLLALRVPEPPVLSAMTGTEGGQTDLALYEKIVAALKGGESYYVAAADAMRAGGYPLRPFLTMRMPGLAVTLAALPDWLPRYLLLALGLTVGVAWFARLRSAFGRLAPQLALVLLLAGSLLAFLQPGLAAFHEIWAGLFVALSLAFRRPGHWIEAVALALVAMLIRETAALYAVVMALLAWRDGERREAFGWAGAILVFGVMLAFHARAVLGVTGPLDPASPGWAGFWGLGLFVKSITLATALQLLPLWGGALLVGLTLFGWAAWDSPLGTRMLAMLLAYGLAIGLFARLDTFYWGLMVAPVFLAGLIFVPDGLRDLFRQALDRRRITVTRVAR